ncbi:MAG: DUF2344 domain-containing protein [Ruminococcaceae bacterium]|nr:DUF2344 domain-containing protein [Oscillospiraceae bacterium]
MVQVNNTPIVLRVRFRKVGKLQYISHLDLVRTMHKIIVRAKLPLWYTEGFNPKPKMVFAAPLSIGTESLCEYMDLRLTERMDTAEALRRLNENLTDEMQASDAYYPTSKLTDLKWLSYTVAIKTNGASDSLAKLCEDVLVADCVNVEKRTKSGENTMVNIRPLIKSVKTDFDGENIRISCVLSADASAFLNPEYVIKALREKLNILSDDDLTKEYYSIMRENAYLADMNEFR